MAKTFIENFTDARRVSTPFVAVRTPDPMSTIRSVVKSLDDRAQADKRCVSAKETPLITWDSIHGLKGWNAGTDGECLGAQALTRMVALANQQGQEIALGASVDLAIALSILEFAGEENIIVFAHNPHLIWATDVKVTQAIWNLRELNTANGNLLVLMIGDGVDLPVELQQDVLTLTEPLPTRDELAKIIVDTYAFAAGDETAEGLEALKAGPTPSVIKAASDALIGIPSFPALQSSAMCLNMVTGELDIPELWSRKKEIVSQRQGLSYYNGLLKLADMYGCEAIKLFSKRFMAGRKRPGLILRLDEMEKQFRGHDTDSSGSTGKLLGEFLTWIEDRKVICSLFVGVPGSSKSHAIYCIGGENGLPVINYSVSGMEAKHVGEGNRHMREANRTIESISDGPIWMIATANSLTGLPPELMRRFQKGGIYFFDAPSNEELNGILDLKIKSYGLDAGQARPSAEAMQGWTGSDVENCAAKAELLDIPLVEAAKCVIPLMKSHHEDMDALRRSAHDRFLSASHDGLYQYSEPPTKTTVHTPVVTSHGRKIQAR